MNDDQIEVAWRCPACGGPLCERTVLGVRLEVCPGCGGIWFDAGELSGLAGRQRGAMAFVEGQVLAASPLHRQDWLGGRMCPFCAVHLSEFEFPWAPGVRLDGCPRCKGIWFDDGELGRIERSGPAGAPRVPGVAPGQQPDALLQRVDAVQRFVTRPHA